MLNTLLRVGLIALIVAGVMAAYYEGACWAYRKPGQSWWGIMRPDRLFRSELYQPEGDRLRRTAQRFYLAVAVLALLIALGLIVRG